jgi:hypothetical protein
VISRGFKLHRNMNVDRCDVNITVKAIDFGIRLDRPHCRWLLSNDHPKLELGKRLIDI